MKISDHLVQLLWDEEYDTSPLQRASFAVNMRLYKINLSYRKCVLEIIRYMDEHLHSHFEDYQDPRGVTAANLGFPLRIIGYKKNANENQFCLNPRITNKSPHSITVQTNCGSLRLKDLATVERSSTIDFEYYDLEGNLVKKTTVAKHEGGFTIQHEIEQTEGRTLIDISKSKQKENFS